jgi:DNA-binding CsgD family transcriptional regulator
VSIPLRPGNAPLLVGRERERGLLEDALAAAISGCGSLVLIGGEAGIGKTALAEAACREATEQGALVLTGHCYDLTDTPPYGAWIDLFTRYTSPAPALPEAFAQRGTVGPVASQMALFVQVQDFLRALTDRQPAVILLDDMHWADPASVALLRSLVHSLPALPLLLIVTYRSDELTRHHPLSQMLPQLARESATRRIDLRALDDAAIRNLVEARYGLADADATRLVAYLHARSEGNALFVGELLRALEESGILAPGEGGWRLGDLTHTGVPALLRNVIDARVSRLDDEAQRLLAIAAVIGHDITPDVWIAVGDADEEEILAVAERGIEAQLLAEAGDEVRFAHALIREALYESIPGVRRRRLHRRAGEALASRPDPTPDTVAYHFQQAGDDRAAAWLIKAGERAEHAYAWLTAIARFEAALTLLGEMLTASERGWLLFRLAALYRPSDPSRTREHLDAVAACATEASDPLLSIYLLFLRGLARCGAGDSARGLPEMEEGVAGLSALPEDQRARLHGLPLSIRIATDEDGVGTLVLRLHHVGRFAAARELGERVIATMPGRTAGGQDDPPRGDAWLGLGSTYTALGLAQEARIAHQHAAAEYHAIGNHFLMVHALASQLLYVCLQYYSDDLAFRRHAIRELSDELSKISGVTTLDPARFIGPALVIEGRWAEARRTVQAMVEQSPNPVADFGELATLCVAWSGDAALVWRLIHRVLPDGPRTEPGNLSWRNTLGSQRVAVTLALDGDDLVSALEWMEAHDRWLAWSGAVLGQSDGQALWAQYYRQTRDATRAKEHAERALQHATAPRQPLALLAAHRLLGELATEAGRMDEARTHLDVSLTLADACAAPYEHALTLLAFAGLHLARRDADTARAAVEEARSICEPLGARPALARADALAARLATGNTVAPIYPAGLSAREVEVLRLLAVGKTNREIADALFLSEHTVRVHVRSILTKTETENRTAAALFSRRHGLSA